MPTARKTSKNTKSKVSSASSDSSLEVDRPTIDEPFREFGAEYMKPKPLSRINNPFVKGLGTVVILVIVIGSAMYLSTTGKIGSLFSNQEDFSAVFLVNGQSFIGNIVKETRKDLVLDNVFYMQVTNETVPGAEDGGVASGGTGTDLDKKGDEFYGPKNSVRINREQIAVIEELSDDSEVLAEIMTRLEDE